MTGAAPVPVPPPIPAVMNTICVFTPKDSMISFIFSSAALRPTSGFEPAPLPAVSAFPICILFGIGLLSNACASVLQMKKSTPSIPSRYIWLTAFPPPPPTPITLMIEDLSFGNSTVKLIMTLSICNQLRLLRPLTNL